MATLGQRALAFWNHPAGPKTSKTAAFLPRTMYKAGASAMPLVTLTCACAVSASSLLGTYLQVGNLLRKHRRHAEAAGEAVLSAADRHHRHRFDLVAVQYSDSARQLQLTQRERLYGSNSTDADEAGSYQLFRKIMHDQNKAKEEALGSAAGSVEEAAKSKSSSAKCLAFSGRWYHLKHATMHGSSYPIYPCVDPLYKYGVTRGRNTQGASRNRDA
eukprot:scaffold1181_cov387-Prasinococcus_capsulatus_cf.AAC.4